MRVTGYASVAELGGRIEPFLHRHLPPGPIPVELVDPRLLLTRSRFSLGTKLLALRSLCADDDSLMDLYEEHIRIFSLGTFEEPGNPDKRSAASYVRVFRELLDDMRARGFDADRSVVPLARDGTLLNGEHRVACAIALGIGGIPCVRTTAVSGDFSERFFRARGASPALLDLSALAFLEHSPRTCTALIWPSAAGHDQEIADILGHVVYSKSVSLSWNGARNAVSEVYRGEPWLGSRDEGFPGADAKAAACFLGDGPLRLLLFQPSSTQSLADIKHRLRDVFAMGKHSVHINDTHAQALEIGNLLLNENSVHFLNFADLKRTAPLFPLLDTFRLACTKSATPLSSVVIDGSAVLAAYGLRAARDIDYQSAENPAPTLEGFDLHEQTLVHHGCSSEALVTDPRKHFCYFGLRFVSLSQLALMKRSRGEEKDLKDCDLIDTLVPARSWFSGTHRMKRKVRFFVARNRRWLEKFERAPIYPLVRGVYRRLFK